MSFGPHPGDSKAIKEDQLISFLHTLAHHLTAALRRLLLVLEESEVLVFDLVP